MKKFQRLMAAVCVVALALAATGCKSSPKKDPFAGQKEKSEAQLRAEAAQLYGFARKSLDNSDYQAAILKYDDLSKIYPFTEYATQGEIERVYALYRTYDIEKALSSADRFVREHPRNPSIDYVQYLKGLCNFDRDPSFSSMVGTDPSKGDMTNQRRSFDDFALLVQKYPTSKYVADARERMIYLRNVIANHDLGVVDFYMRRGAFLAAANRASQVVSQYPGSPASYQALQLMEKAYRDGGLTAQADDAHRILMAQPPRHAAGTQAAAANEQSSFWSRLIHRDEAPAASAEPAATPPAIPAPPAAPSQ